ncbi:unnamed protein product [Leptosia nina]|uniref:Uncharacterized protein n=1 Tax=Leptosia nina TaxID=320188 RepID=A0AAV1J6F9_9NEOP
MMYRILLISATIASVLSAEIPRPLEQQNPALEGVETHPVYKKPRSEEHHPIYRVNKDEVKDIDAVRNMETIGKHDMLADDPARVLIDTNPSENLPVEYTNPGEVAYPDIPYAPGYNYGNAYAANAYDLYGNSLGDYFLEPDTSSASLLWSQVPNSRMRAIIFVIFTHIFFVNVDVQGLGIDDGNLIDYEPAFQNGPYPYWYNQELNPVRRDVHMKKKNLPDPVNNDLSLVSAPMISNVFELFMRGVSFILTRIPLVLFGTIAAFGACALTPICDTRILDALPNIEKGLRSFTSPERISRAAEFVETAIRKYGALNK